MPTYEYACKSCGEHLDVFQSFTDDPLTTCPTCGGPLRKVFGNIGIAFKGSGFYRNDSRSGSSSAKKEPAKSDASKSESSNGDAKSSGDSKGSGDSKPSSSEGKSSTDAKPTSQGASKQPASSGSAG